MPVFPALSGGSWCPALHGGAQFLDDDPGDSFDELKGLLASVPSEPLQFRNRLLITLLA